MALPNSILFICQMNMVRSPMAEGWMRKLYPDVGMIASCGLNQGDADQLVQTVMSEAGADLSQHTPRTLESFEGQEFDTVIAFTNSAYEAAKVYFENTDSEVLHWPLPDPGEGSLDVRAIMNNYRAMRDLIKNRLIRHFDPS